MTSNKSHNYFKVRLNLRCGGNFFIAKTTITKMVSSFLTFSLCIIKLHGLSELHLLITQLCRNPLTLYTRQREVSEQCHDTVSLYVYYN